MQQAFGKYFVMSGEYIWKYTHNAYDFTSLGDPVTFPIEWNNSKIPGFAVRGTVPNYHGFTAFIVMSGVEARFFTPQSAASAPRRRGARFPHRPRRKFQPNHPPPIPAFKNVAPGSASTGAMTAAWLPAQCPAPAKLRTARGRLPWTCPVSRRTNNSKLDCSAEVCNATPTTPIGPNSSCARHRNTAPSPANSRARDRE